MTSRYQGGCHCGAVRFELSLTEPIAALLNCNCSVCTKKGILHTPVEDDQFSLLSGEDSLLLYQFHSNAARHWFCRRCGIHTHGRPRSAPHRYTVNARCLDDFAAILPVAATRQFDGINHPMDGAG